MMSTLQDIREYIVSTTKCPYTPPFGNFPAWQDNQEQDIEDLDIEDQYRHEAVQASLYLGDDNPFDSFNSFSKWHQFTSDNFFKDYGKLDYEDYQKRLFGLKAKHGALVSDGKTHATLCTCDGFLLTAGQAGDGTTFNEFITLDGETSLEFGQTTLSIRSAEVPPGSITAVMTMVKGKPNSLVFVKINECDFASKETLDELQNFINFGLVGKTALASLTGEQKTSVLSFTIWKGCIKFHGYAETQDNILPDIDITTFRNHIRLKSLLVSSITEQNMSRYIDDIITSFTPKEIEVAPRERKLLGWLLSKASTENERGNFKGIDGCLPKLPEIPKFLNVFTLKSILDDCALVNGFDTMHIPETRSQRLPKSPRPSTSITLPVAEANDIIAGHTSEKPFWYGRFWTDQEVKFGEDLEPVGNASACIKRICNLPYDEVIEATLKLQPKAEELLRRWREAWDRSFPGWQSKPQWHFDKSEKETTDQYVHDIQRAFNWIENQGVSKAEGVSILDNWVVEVGEDKRDYRLHVIDDADAVCSMVHLSPGAGFFYALGVIIQYTGQDEDGYPIFSEAPEAKLRVDKRLDSHPEYWNWPFYKKYLGRQGVVTKNGEHTAAVLADMALQGHTHAFLKGVAQKSGTWTVNLKHVSNLETAYQRLHATIERDHVNQAMYVQEHVPFTHEQRYYIQGGRMFASACSDRHFSVMDSNGKRLDSRVAILEVPAIDGGVFDRGVTRHVEDRKTSAMFARQVRKIVAELREHGIQDYSIDMGLTERGMISVEVNTLHMAGPYNMRRELYTKQFERSRKKANDLLAKGVVEIIQKSKLPDYIQQKAIAMTCAADNLVQLALSFADANPHRTFTEEERIAMLILIFSILDKNGSATSINAEAA
jgi:hypothetical protein